MKTFTAGAILSIAFGTSSAVAQVAPPAQDALNPLQAIEKSSLTGFREKPLFSPARAEPDLDRPAPVYVPPPPVAPSVPPPNLTLSGIVEGDPTLAAVRINGSDKTTMLATGDHIGDWLVTVVPPLGLRLSNGARVIDFGLFARTSTGGRTEPATASPPAKLAPPPGASRP